MIEETISLINKRGRIIKVRKEDLKRSLALGLRIFPNPKENYYPNFDSEFNNKVSEIPLPSEKIEGKLEVIVL